MAFWMRKLFRTFEKQVPGVKIAQIYYLQTKIRNFQPQTNWSILLDLILVSVDLNG